MDAKPSGRDYVYYSSAWNSIVIAINNKIKELGRRSTLQVAMIVSRVHEITELMHDCAIRETVMGFEDCYITQLYEVDIDMESEITLYENTVSLIPVSGYEKCHKCMKMSSGWTLQSTLGPMSGRYFCSEECALSAIKSCLIDNESELSLSIASDIAEAISNPTTSTESVALMLCKTRIMYYERHGTL